MVFLLIFLLFFWGSFMYFLSTRFFGFVLKDIFCLFVFFPILFYLYFGYRIFKRFFVGVSFGFSTSIRFF